jgi:6-phosphogluconolactonase
MKTDYFDVMLAPVVSLIWLAPPLEAQFAGTDNISAYRIGSDGALTPIAGSPFPAGSKPDSVVVDSKAKFLYVANGGGSNNVSAYSIGSNGALTPIPGSPFPAGSLPSSVVIRVLGRFM